MSSAVLKRLPSCPQVLPNSPVALGFRKKSDHLPMDRLRAVSWLQPPVFTYTCCSRHALIAAGLEVVRRQIGNRWWVAKLTFAGKFYSERPVHRDNPNLSAWEVLTQWHGEPLRRKMARLQWMTSTYLSATSCSKCSNDLAATAFTTVGSSGEFFRLFRRESGFASSGADTA